MLVARGGGEVDFEPELRIWDYAALAPIVEEAGGRMTALDGGAHATARASSPPTGTCTTRWSARLAG